MAPCQPASDTSAMEDAKPTEATKNVAEAVAEEAGAAMVEGLLQVLLDQLLG